MAPLKVGMADAMRAALQHSSPRSKPLHHLDVISDKIRSRIVAINEQLDQEATSEQGPDHLPMLLRHLQNPSVTEEFAAIIKFVSTEWHTLLNWRDCAAHKTRLSKMDLNDPRQAFLDMADKLGHLSCDDHEVDLFGKERPKQVIDPKLIDPNLEVRLDSQYVFQPHTAMRMFSLIRTLGLQQIRRQVTDYPLTQSHRARLLHPVYLRSQDQPRSRSRLLDIYKIVVSSYLMVTCPVLLSEIQMLQLDTTATQRHMSAVIMVRSSLCEW
jgi:hypothetical protein